MRKPSPNVLFIVTLLLAAGLVVYVLWHSSRVTDRATRLGFQDADEPPTLSDPIDRRFDLLSAWDVTRIPTATRFGHPLGVPFRVVGKFGEAVGENAATYPGDLLTGIGGENTSLGDPVFAVGDGLVLFAGQPSEEWGNVVLLGHRLPDGGFIQSLYGHLHRIEVKPGDLVPLGGRVGLIGTADGHYPAHLHFQILRGRGAFVPTNPATAVPAQIDPSAFLEEMGADPAGGGAPSPLGRALAADGEPWTALEIKGAELLPDLRGANE